MAQCGSGHRRDRGRRHGSTVDRTRLDHRARRVRAVRGRTRQLRVAARLARRAAVRRRAAGDRGIPDRYRVCQCRRPGQARHRHLAHRAGRRIGTRRALPRTARSRGTADAGQCGRRGALPPVGRVGTGAALCRASRDRRPGHRGLVSRPWRPCRLPLRGPSAGGQRPARGPAGRRVPHRRPGAGRPVRLRATPGRGAIAVAGLQCRLGRTCVRSNFARDP